MSGSVRNVAVVGLSALLAAGLLSPPVALAAAVRYEAEQATIINGTVASNHPGFTGTGFVDTTNAVGAAVEFAVTAPAASSEPLAFRYANGTTTDRPATLTVNGANGGTVSFPPTGDWANWQTRTPTAALAAGSNTIRLTATTAGGLPNLDSLTVGTEAPSGDVIPSLAPNLVASYDFEHPAPGNAAVELDQGLSGTSVNLINGGAAMRVNDGAYPRSATSLQLQQVRPTVKSNDDWKAGRWSDTGVASLNAFSHVQGITIMGWFKMTGTNPSPNSNTSSTTDFYGAVSMAGLLSGDSDGHKVRALIELFEVSGKLRLVVLGRRLDSQPHQAFAATEDWHTLLPQNTWVFLAATLNYNTGAMALYKDGQPVPGFFSDSGDPWAIHGGGGPFFSSATNPRGIKTGGGFPQNTREDNPCNCRADGLMFLSRDATASEIAQQYALLTTAR
jgi:alpha-galactosidase-like CBM13-containing protein